MFFVVQGAKKRCSFFQGIQKMIFLSGWWIEPGHGEACRRRFPTLCAEFPRLAVGKPEMTALDPGTIKLRMSIVAKHYIGHCT